MLDKLANKANITQRTVRSDMRATPTIISKKRPIRMATKPNNSNRYIGLFDGLRRNNWWAAIPIAEKNMAREAIPPKIPCSTV